MLHLNWRMVIPARTATPNEGPSPSSNLTLFSITCLEEAPSYSHCWMSWMFSPIPTRKCWTSNCCPAFSDSINLVFGLCYHGVGVGMEEVHESLAFTPRNTWIIKEKPSLFLRQETAITKRITTMLPGTNQGYLFTSFSPPTYCLVLNFRWIYKFWNTIGLLKQLNLRPSNNSKG